MTAPDLERLVISTVAAACRADRAALTPATELREIGLDSLSLMSVAVSLEAACGIELGDETAAELLGAQRLGDLIELLHAASAREIGGRPPGV